MTEGARLRVGVLASGRGSNFESIAAAAAAGRIPAEVVLLLSDRREVGALEIARAHGIAAEVVEPRDHPGREAHDKALVDHLESRRVRLVCLAGYMRILGPAFVGHFRGRLLNVHPSLLPAFPGARAIEDAVAARVAVTGVSVHLVDEGLDSGPVLEQRIHAVEHELLPRVVRQLCAR